MVLVQDFSTCSYSSFIESASSFVHHQHLPCSLYSCLNSVTSKLLQRHQKNLRSAPLTSPILLHSPKSAKDKIMNPHRNFHAAERGLVFTEAQLFLQLFLPSAGNHAVGQCRDRSMIGEAPIASSALAGSGRDRIGKGPDVVIAGPALRWGRFIQFFQLFQRRTLRCVCDDEGPCSRRIPRVLALCSSGELLL